MTTVTVIVPTKNSAQTLEACLQSISNQTHKEIELIVSDNYSSDATLLIARKFNAIIISKPNTERSEQINLAAKIAKGKYLLRIDSDFILDSNLIENAIDKITQGYDATTIFIVSAESPSIWARVRKAERACYQEDWHYTVPWFFKKDVFDKIGGYDEHLIGWEDYGMRDRLIQGGFKMGRINAKVLHLGEPNTLKEIFTKYLYYGTKVEEFMKVTPGWGGWQISPLRLVFIRKRKNFAGSVKLVYSFLIYQYVRYVGALLGLISKW